MRAGGEKLGSNEYWPNSPFTVHVLLFDLIHAQISTKYYIKT